VIGASVTSLKPFLFEKLPLLMTDPQSFPVRRESQPTCRIGQLELAP
jgi:hypothetical protein